MIDSSVFRNKKMMRDKDNTITVLVRGGGDIASAVIYRLWKTGMRVIVCDLERPSCVRRSVSFCNSVYEKEWTIEGVTARYIGSVEVIDDTIRNDLIPVLTIPDRDVLAAVQPDVFIDATIAKRTPDYDPSWAPLVIALGPSITAGKDADLVIETQRGHFLGTIIREGQAIANTGIPGHIGGFSKERVLRAPCDGEAVCLRRIGDHVLEGDTILTVCGMPVKTIISGIVRGLIAPGYSVHKGMKVGDVDPRDNELNCATISDKGRTISGAVLEAVISFFAANGAITFRKIQCPS